jgi:malonyl CoA-acyl carrier protein transacylase
MFPGQGAQHVGMGRGLFDEVPQFGALEAQVDAILGYSLRELCLKDPHGRLSGTRYTQPAVFVVNALHWFQSAPELPRVSYLMGHSLGEYNALLAAGVFDLLTGLRIVRKRAELMASAPDGAMAAVIGLKASAVEQLLALEGLTELDVANDNAPTQVVVSGPTAVIRRAGPVFKKAGASLYVELNVGAACHSRYMSAAAELFDKFLASEELREPCMPVISNVTAEPYPTGCDAATIRALLVAQLTHRVRWRDAVLALLQGGVAAYRELGPGSVLTRLLQRIREPADPAFRQVGTR